MQLDSESGFCTKALSGESFIIDEENLLRDPLENKWYTWWEMQPIMIQMPPGTWAAIKKFVIEVCAKTKQCDDKAITSWNRTTEQIDWALEEKQGAVNAP